MGIVKISKKEVQAIKEIVSKYVTYETPLVEILHEINGIYKCIPLAVSKLISIDLGIPMSQVNSTATFYDYFTETPLGDIVIRICEGASCVVNGSESLTKILKDKLNLEDNHTTDDGKVTVEITYCNGHCDKSPTITVNDQLHTNVDVFELGSIVKEYVK
ncbi:NAD(P)H-dependent oxidoreductase subunit E [Mycoplasmatota bacterium WC44]